MRSFDALDPLPDIIEPGGARNVGMGASSYGDRYDADSRWRHDENRAPRLNATLSRLPPELRYMDESVTDSSPRHNTSGIPPIPPPTGKSAATNPRGGGALGGAGGLVHPE